MIFSLEQAPAKGEVATLQLQAKKGIPVPTTLVLDGLEAEFYQNGNLGEQIRRLFDGVFGARLDEDRLEASCEKAQRLIRETYLFPEHSEEIKKRVPSGRVSVRYSGQKVFEVVDSSEILFTVKRLWVSRWDMDSVLERAPKLAPEELPVLIQAT